MLSKEHSIVSCDWQTGKVVADRLTRRSHSQYARYADRMLDVYRTGTGRPRRELHLAVERLLADEPDCPARRVHAFCKLLDDVSEYRQDRAGSAAELRRKLFRLAAPLHPLVMEPDGLFEHGAQAVKDRLAKELGSSWAEIEGRLFTDVIEFQPLVRFDGYTDGAELLSRYNVAQAQAVLYDALDLTVRARADFKRILRAAKLSRLMHTIHRRSDGSYDIRLDGPASALRQTRRYGVAMAKFLPTLLACFGWTLHARLASRRRAGLRFELSSEDGLQSHLPASPEFDSDVEQAFAERWGNEPREGWTLFREPTIVHRQQKVFIPDFEFRHADGRRVMMEVVGFWTPEYLAAKLQTLHEFADTRMLLAVTEQAEVGQDWQPPATQPVVTFKSVIKVSAVLDALQRWGMPDAGQGSHPQID
ncbi:MAG: DUF790 family protein [Pirellulales bacterium]